LEQTVHLRLVSPTAAVVVELHTARADITHDGISPPRKVYGVTGDFRTEQANGFVFRFGKVQAAASSTQCCQIAYLCRNSYNVRHMDSSDLM